MSGLEVVTHTDKPYYCGLCRKLCMGNYGFFTDVLDEDNYCPDCAHRISNAPSYVKKILKTTKDLIKDTPSHIHYQTSSYLMVFFKDINGSLTEDMLTADDFLKLPLEHMPEHLHNTGLFGRLAALRLEKGI